jgi:hypothetical protein
MYSSYLNFSLAATCSHHVYIIVDFNFYQQPFVLCIIVILKKVNIGVLVEIKENKHFY